MLGPQTDTEIPLWCVEVSRSMGGLRQDTAEDAMQRADDLLAAYRLRYGLPQPAADDRIGRAAIEAMNAILGVMGNENASNQRKASAIDRIATQYVAARWHIEKESSK